MWLHRVVYTFYFFTATGCDYVWEDNMVFFLAHSFRERSSAVSRIRVVVESSSGKKEEIRGGVLCKQLRYTTHHVRGLTRKCNNNIWVDRRRIPVIGANAVTTRHRYWTFDSTSFLFCSITSICAQIRTLPRGFTLTANSRRTRIYKFYNFVHYSTVACLSPPRLSFYEAARFRVFGSNKRDSTVFLRIKKLKKKFKNNPSPVEIAFYFSQTGRCQTTKISIATYRFPHKHFSPYYMNLFTKYKMGITER